MQYPSDAAKTIRRERGKRYEQSRIAGEPAHHHGFAQLGRTWAAVMSEHFGIRIPDLPPHVVALMMVQLKLNRAARPTVKRDADDYVDGHVYFDLAYDIDPYVPHSTKGTTNEVTVSTRHRRVRETNRQPVRTRRRSNRSDK